MSHYDPPTRQVAADIVGQMREFQHNHSNHEDRILRTEALMLRKAAERAEGLLGKESFVAEAINELLLRARNGD